MSTINVSTDAYNAIRQAIDTVYKRTGRKPKYSEVQAIYKTSNSYIKHVMADWMDEHKDDLTKPTAESQHIELDQATIQAVTASFIAELKKAKDQAESELDDERQALYAIRDDAVDEMNAQMQIADDRLSEVEQLQAELQSLQNTSKELDILKSKYDEAQNRIKRLESELERKDNRISQLADASLEDKQKIAELKGTVTALQSKSN